MNTGIYIVYYQNKPYEFETEFLIPIAAGDLTNEWKKKDKLNDQINNNISELNNYFRELSAHYNIWKNNFYDKEIVGFYHYRRYLNLIKLDDSNNERLYLEPTKEVLNFISDTNQISNAEKILTTYDIIVPEKFKLKTNFSSHFCIEHNQEIWQDF